ncbi:hypothetical protein H5410_004475 [Solanum commersonii]|uniref:Uncharacterized protein n=1 Tax=Solanum commersonii TaxID=4109 RepID=A0A9J6B7T6_SOLCO|nr:hypothetical protein H5410_004475 [Solanum commersonii]
MSFSNRREGINVEKTFHFWNTASSCLQQRAVFNLIFPLRRWGIKLWKQSLAEMQASHKEYS